jgi:1-acyl-sn-glycerol-3-phosphate acyltransferase
MATRPSVLQLLTTCYFWLVFAITIPVGVFLGGLLYLATRPFDPFARVMHAYNCYWTFDYLKINPGWRIRILGQERLPHGPCVLVANHQSMADVPALMGVRHSFKFVSKHSLFALPFVGWMMRLAGYVDVDRDRRKSAQRMLERCHDWLDRGLSVLIFPEGTYNGGERLLPFRRGAFSLAMEAGVPLVPIAVSGTRALLDGDGPWLSPRCDIQVSVLEPLAPGLFGGDVSALASRTQELLARELGLHEVLTDATPLPLDQDGGNSAA